jgi:O-antigen/teichoic acid export membrane protein
LLVPGSLVLILTPQAALSLFFPEQYHGVSSALQVAAIGGLLLALSTLLIGVYQAEGKRRQPALASAFAVFVQIISLVVLVPSFGILGAAFSLLLAGAVSLLGLVPLFWSGLILRLQARNFSLTLSQINRNIFPLITLSLLLILLPDGNRFMVVIKLSSAALIYLLSLMFVQLRIPTRSQTSTNNLFSQFMQVLIGG